MAPQPTGKLGTSPNARTTSSVSLYPAVFAVATALLIRLSSSGAWTRSLRIILVQWRPRILARGRECHASLETIEVARQYLMDIGGQVVLTLVPHSQYCRPSRMNWQRRLESKFLFRPTPATQH
jgi:hypothetical protein